ncbi:Bifunctional purine biosynthesis protein PurH [Coemansia sp. RSA 922]|nr:Bifunctional purine biosynthesis protein PurH [Coemansia sp. S680]KAJ2040370.1 Bifunctional purine biosynthesis protein PurH [Coemansia sp. S3946]KAJ2107563.1 Bifunctional purine biosynthesis protein PurH [Coemansia sp. RSA 922]
MATQSQAVGITKYQLFCVLAASVGSVNWGWTFGATNIPGDVISKCAAGPSHLIGFLPSCIPASENVWGLVVGCFALGCLIGALTSTYFANRYGRKTVLVYSNIPAIIAAIMYGLSVNMAMLIIARLLSGIALGSSLGTFTMYVVEITTPKARNSLGGMAQMAIIFGIMLSQTASLGLSKPPFWRLLFAISGILSVLNMALLYFCVESPKWLAMNGKLADARDSLQRLRRGTDYTDEFVQLTSSVMINSTSELAMGETNNGTKTSSVIDVLLGRTPDNLRHQLVVTIVVMASQQTSGISGVSFYSSTLFNSISKSDPSDVFTIPTLAHILSSVLAIAGTLVMPVCMVLAMYFGRRPLMIWSHGVMAVCCVLISVGSIVGLNALSITMVFVYYAAFFIGAGPIPWICPNEMTPTYAVAAVGAIGGSVNYVIIFVIGLVFSPLLDALGGYTFLLFGVANLLSALFCFFYLPETKDCQVADVARLHSVGVHSVLRAKYRIDPLKSSGENII